MKVFNVGDKVRYIEDGGSIKKGTVCVVRAVRETPTMGQGINLEGHPDDDAWWYSSRFELVESEKPPLGLMPRKLATEKRLVEILQAMTRYAEVGKTIPDAWDEEYAELYAYLRKAA